MQKFRLISDLHLEFDDTLQLSIQDDDRDTILLVAGDSIPIASLNHADRAGRFATLLNDWSNRFKSVYMIMGNHEHYGYVIDVSYDNFSSWISSVVPNVTLLEDQAVQLSDDIVLVGSTLWTNFNHGSPIDMMIAGNGMYDYHAIKTYDYARGQKQQVALHPRDIMTRHYKSFQFIQHVVNNNPDKRIVVMTHHAPTYQSVSPQFIGDPMNSAFVSDYSEWILEHPSVAVWCHGHVHDPFDYTVGETRVLCNPRGYPNERNSWNDNCQFVIGDNQI